MNFKDPANQTEVFQKFTVQTKRPEKLQTKSDNSLQSNLDLKLQSLSEELRKRRRIDLNDLRGDQGISNPSNPENIEEKHIGILEMARRARNRHLPQENT